MAPNTVITTYTSGDDFYHNLGLVVKNLKDQDCFMKRFLVVCADSACSEQATADGYNNIEFPEDSSNSDTSYGRFTWMKQKISLGVVGSGVNMFMVDADVVLFSVPETNSFLSQSNVDGMFQEDYMDYHVPIRTGRSGRNSTWTAFTPGRVTSTLVKCGTEPRSAPLDGFKPV